MTDDYVYWVKQNPRGCKNCDQLWRTDLADGSVASALPSRKGRISRLVTRGSLVGITEIYKTKSKYQSRVRIINEDGSSRVLASAVYRPSQSRRCGSIVGAGALAASGELAWQRVAVPKSKFTCRELPDRVLWSAFAGGLDGTTRQLVKQREQSSILLYFHEALDQVKPILGFDGVRLLTSDQTATDVRTGRTFRYRLEGGSTNNEDGELGPAGQVAAFFYLDALDKRVPFLFTTPMSVAPAVDLSVDGYETTALKFCGESIVQLTFNEAQGEIGVLRRDLEGTITSTKLLKLGPGQARPSFICNQARSVIFTAGKAFLLEL